MEGREEGDEQEQQQGQGAGAPSSGPVSDFAEDERIFREQEARQKREAEETKTRMAASEEDINDIDEDDNENCDVDSQFGDDDINDIDEDPFEEVDESTKGNFVHSSRSNSIAEEREREQLKEKERVAENIRKRQSWAQKDPMVHIACLQAENEEIEREMTQLRQELLETRQECDSYKNNYHDMMLDLEDVREEAHMFLEQLEAAELECQGATRREMAAMDVLNQLSAGSIAKGGGIVPIPAEVSQQFLKNVQEAADLVQKGYDLTGEYGYNLEDSIQLSNDQSVEYAQKTAFSAAIMVDKSGVFSQKYDSESLATDLISRLEESLQVSLEQSPSEEGGQGWFDEDMHDRYPGRRGGGDEGAAQQQQQQQQQQQREPEPEPEQPVKKPQQPRRPPPPPRGHELQNDDPPYDNYQEQKYSESAHYMEENNIFDQSSDYQPQYQQDDYQQSRYSHENQGYDSYNQSQQYAAQPSYRDQELYGFNQNSNRNSLFHSPEPSGFGNARYGGGGGGGGISPPQASLSGSKPTSPIKFGPRKKVVSKARKGSKKAGFR